MGEKTKIIIQAFVIFGVVWTGGVAVHELFLDLEYGILRSFIVGVGIGAWRYVAYIRNRQKSHP